MLDYEHRGDILSATTAAAAKAAGESAMTAFKNEATSSENVVFVDSLDEAKAGNICLILRFPQRSATAKLL